MIFKILFGFFVLLSLVSILTLQADGQEMSNDELILELEVTSKPTTTQKPLRQEKKIIAQTVAKMENNKYGKVSINISDINISFGEIKPGEPLIRTHSVGINSDQRLNLHAIQNAPLRSTDGSVIPQARCDKGTCSEFLSGLWISPLSFGFGYRCSSDKNICDKEFSKPDMYKHFPEALNQDYPSLILETGNLKKTESTIEYKINIPPTLKDKNFKTEINYIIFALP